MNFSQEQIMGWVVSNQHIPSEEIERDIADTEHEIANMRREIDAFRILADTGDRMADMRARARESGIKEREAFNAKLKAILEARRVISGEPPAALRTPSTKENQ